MSTNKKQCSSCELPIPEFKQITEEDIIKLSEHMSTKDTCEWCLLAKLGELEYQ